MSRGFFLYVDAVALLKRKPRTTAQLHRALGRSVGMHPLRRILRRLMDADVLRSAGWTAGRNPERVYGVADGRPNVLHPVRSERPVKPTAHVTMFASIWHELAGPTSALELHEATGTPAWNGRKLMQRMADLGLVGVRYEITGVRRTAYYQRGVASEPRPPRQSAKERYARQKEGRAARTMHEVFTFRAAPLQA